MKKRFKEDLAMLGAGTLTGAGVVASTALARSGLKQKKPLRVLGGVTLFPLSLVPAALYTLMSYVDTEEDPR